MKDSDLPRPAMPSRRKPAGSRPRRSPAGWHPIYGKCTTQNLRVIVKCIQDAVPPAAFETIVPWLEKVVSEPCEPKFTPDQFHDLVVGRIIGPLERAGHDRAALKLFGVGLEHALLYYDDAEAMLRLTAHMGQEKELERVYARYVDHIRKRFRWLARDFDPAGNAANPLAIGDRDREVALAHWRRYHDKCPAQRIHLMREFDELLCTESLVGVIPHRYQAETARRILNRFRGRAILADEVGLGKTIEAGLVIKEYLLRGLARRVLILVPPALVSQWQGEMLEKFGLEFATTAAAEAREDPAAFWGRPLVLASLGLARLEPHAGRCTAQPWDLVVVDEAHHLRTATSRSHKLVKSLPRKFLLLLTATPVQNQLMELYHLINLLQPGTLGTAADFRARFVQPHKPTEPLDRDQLRALLRTVMIRNTRSFTDVKLPRRFASTIKVEPLPREFDVLHHLGRALSPLFTAGDGRLRMACAALLGQVGSSLLAALPALERFAARDLARDFTFIRCQPAALDPVSTLVPVSRIGFRLSMVGDETRERLLTMDVLEASRRILPPGRGLPEVIDPVPLPADDPRLTAFLPAAELLAAVEPRAVARAEEEARAFQQTLQHRLSLDLARLEDYFSELVRALDGERRRQALTPEERAAKRQAIEEDFRRQVEDVRARSALRAELRPFALQRLLTPAWRVRVIMRLGTLRRPEEFLWTPFERRFEPYACPECAGFTTRLEGTRDGRLLCPACAGR